MDQPQQRNQVGKPRFKCFKRWCMDMLDFTVALSQKFTAHRYIEVVIMVVDFAILVTFILFCVNMNEVLSLFLEGRAILRDIQDMIEKCGNITTLSEAVIKTNYLK